MRNDAHIPDGWHIKTLSELSGSITSGATPESGNPRYYTPTDGHPFAKIEDLTKAIGHELHDCGLQITDAALRETAAKLYPTGTILVSMYGTIGLVKVCGQPLSANQALCALLPPFICDPSFLLHHLDFIRSDWTKYSGQTTQPNINGSVVRAHQVLLPPMDEQGAIKEILDTLDTAIRQTEAIIAKLKQVKQGLLHDLLSRGIDANGELRPPQCEAPHLYKASQLGWIPLVWTAVELDQLVDRQRPIVYGILMPGQGHEGGVPVVKVRDIVNGQIQEQGLLQTSPEIDREYRRSRLAEGDLLFTIRGTVGRTAFVPSTLAGANITQDTARISLAGIDGRFVREFLRMPVPSRFIATHTLGVAVQGINLRDVRRIPLAMPSASEAAMIGDRIDAVGARLLSEESVVAKLVQEKSGLMDDLLTGRVRVTPLLTQAPTTLP